MEDYKKRCQLYQTNTGTICHTKKQTETETKTKLFTLPNFYGRTIFWRRDDAHNYSNFLLNGINKMRERTRRNSGRCKTDVNNLDIEADRTIANAFPVNGNPTW